MIGGYLPRFIFCWVVNGLITFILCFESSTSPVWRKIPPILSIDYWLTMLIASLVFTFLVVPFYFIGWLVDRLKTEGGA